MGNKKYKKNKADSNIKAENKEKDTNRSFREISVHNSSIFGNKDFDFNPEKLDLNTFKVSKFEVLRASEVPPRPLVPKTDNENKNNDEAEGSVME